MILLIFHSFVKKDKYGRATLQNAAIFISKETADYLILFDANINEKDKYGKTALRFASFHNNRNDRTYYFKCNNFSFTNCSSEKIQNLNYISTSLQFNG